MEGEWSCYGGGQFNRGSMITLEVVSLMEGEWSCYGEMASFMEGEWSC